MRARSSAAQNLVAMATGALALLASAAVAAQDLDLAPAAVAETARDVRLEVRRADGQPFCSAPACQPWVGVGFTTLRRLRTSASPPARPAVLTVRLAGVADLATPPPRAGDIVIVVVYQGDRPISAPARLVIVAGDSDERRDGPGRGAEEGLAPRGERNEGPTRGTRPVGPWGGGT